MNKNLNPDKYGMVILEVDRKEIESFDHISILELLEGIKQDALKYEGKLNILIRGYDHDSRELYEIEEVKKYFIFLDKCFPYWFFFLIRTLPKKFSPFSVLISLLVPFKEILSKDSKKHVVEIDMDELEKFMNTHFEFLNQLTEDLNLPINENMRISKEVLKNLSNLIS